MATVEWVVAQYEEWKSGRVEEWKSGRVEEKSRTTDAVHVVVVVLIFFCYFSAPGCCR